MWDYWFKTPFRSFHWIGWRENLQETRIFYHQIGWFFLSIFPTIQWSLEEFTISSPRPWGQVDEPAEAPQARIACGWTWRGESQGWKAPLRKKTIGDAIILIPKMWLDWLDRLLVQTLSWSFGLVVGNHSKGPPSHDQSHEEIPGFWGPWLSADRLRTWSRWLRQHEGQGHRGISPLIGESVRNPSMGDRKLKMLGFPRLDQCKSEVRNTCEAKRQFGKQRIRCPFGGGKMQIFLWTLIDQL